MKKVIIRGILPAILSVGMFACGGGSKQGVKWDTFEAPAAAGSRSSDEISINYPVAAAGTAAEDINREIRNVLSGLIGFPGQEVAAAADMLIEQRNSDTLLGHIDYTVTVDGNVMTYGRVASIELEVYQYTGGAHGLGNTIYLNMDTRSGAKLSLGDMFTDTAALEALNRKVFGEYHKGNIDNLALFKPVHELPLPENAGIDQGGLHVQYNPYEIAPYSTGAIDYLIPMAEISELINRKAFF